MFISNLQILRAIAAIWVVIFHATYHVRFFSERPSPAIDALGRLGYLGVDIFFVISGFVIYFSAINKPNLSGRSFIRNRFERIVPPYFLLTLGFILLTVAFPNFSIEREAVTLSRSISSLFYVSFVSFHRPQMIVGWTLEFEMFFYILTACIISLRKQQFDHIPVVISSLVCLGYIFSKLFPKNNIISFFTNPLMIEFALGFIIAQFLATKKIGAITMFSIFLSFITIGLSNRNLLIGIIGATLLIYMAVRFDGKMVIPEKPRKILEQLGNASYSIYLIQVFTLPLSGHVVSRAYAQQNPTMFGFFGITLSIASGWLFHIFVEKKLLAYLRKSKRLPAVDNSLVVTQQQAISE